MGNMELDVALAARNNAAWCDIVCRSHGAPGEYRDHAWFTKHPTPPYYPNMVTLTPNDEARHLTVVEEIVDTIGGTHDIGVKDSFANLDLTSRGFTPIIEAKWYALTAPPRASTSPHVIAITGEAELLAWEAAWSATSPTNIRMFREELLANDDVLFVGAPDGADISADFTAGIIANRSEGAVGISNFFAPPAIARTFIENALSVIAARYPGMPIVGYGSDAEAAFMSNLGFATIAPLRVWVRRPQT